MDKPKMGREDRLRAAKRAAGQVSDQLQRNAAALGAELERPLVGPEAAGPPPITETSTWREHQGCDITWVAPGLADEHAVCIAHRVRFDLPSDEDVRHVEEVA